MVKKKILLVMAFPGASRDEVNKVSDSMNCFLHEEFPEIGIITFSEMPKIQVLDLEYM